MNRLSKLILLVLTAQIVFGELNADPPRGPKRAVLGGPVAVPEPAEALPAVQPIAAVTFLQPIAAPEPTPVLPAVRPAAALGFMQPTPPATLPPANGATTIFAAVSLANTPPETWRVRAEYLLWWTKGQAIPSIATTSPAGTPRANAGVQGTPGVQTVFGDERGDDGLRSGGRFQVLYWYDAQQSIGIETDFLFLANTAQRFGLASAGDPILARPFFNVLTGRQNSVLTGYPGLVSGTLNGSASTGMLYGAEVNGRSNVLRGSFGRIDLLAGYRFLGFSDGLSVYDTEIDARNQQRIDVADRFRSESNFHGGQIGAVVEYRRGMWYAEFTSKLAIGGTCSTVDIDGRTSVGGAAPVSGGILATPSNIGHYHHSNFAVLPELGLNFGYQISPRLRMFAGYTILYLSSVTRAAEQVDLAINPNQFVPPIPGGPQQPAFRFQTGDFWAQGVNVGMELRY